jgi:hypothetical protein
VNSYAALLACWVVVAGAFHSMRFLDIPSDPAGPFMLRFAVAWVGWLVACSLVGRVGRSDAAGAADPGEPPRSEARRNLVVGILLGGVALRVVAWSVPVLLETDVHRYLWDGFVLSQGENPYRFSPEEVMRAQAEDVTGFYAESENVALRRLATRARDPRIAGHLSQVNHPEVPTCYPPIAQHAFHLSARISPGDVDTWKAIVALVDVLVCGMVLLLLVELGRDPTWVIFYAWNPLPIKEYANTGHYDPLATVFVVAAICALLRRRGALGGALLGLGIGGKVYPLVLVPVLWRRLGGAGVTLALVVPWILLIPFLDVGLHLFDGLLAFAKDWEFNSSLFALVAAGMARLGLPEYRITTYWKVTQGDQALPLGDYLQELTIGDFLVTKVLMGLVLVAVLVALARWQEDRDWSVPGRALAALTALLMLAPVCDPWYLPWLLPYAAAFPAPAWLYLSGSMVCYYAYFLQWRYLPWHRPVEYLPFFALLAWSLRDGLGAHLASFEATATEPISQTGCDASSDSPRPSD